MEDLLFELVSAIIGILFEVFLELIGMAVLELVSRTAAGALAILLETVEDWNPLFVALGCGVLGLAAGVLSILVLPHPLVHWTRRHPFHGISLLISPVITGLVMSLVGVILRKEGKRLIPIETFACGFTFALGMALIRFFFAK